MTQSDRNGLIIMVGLFVVLALLLIFSMKPPPTSSNSIENNAVIEQRIINLRKDR